MGTKQSKIRAGRATRSQYHEKKGINGASSLKPGHCSGDILQPEPNISSIIGASSLHNEEHHEQDIVTFIRSNVIGGRSLIQTPFGTRELVYADYTASGRALRFIERYMMEVVLTNYANTHTEASSTGAQTTHLREEARDIIHQALNAPKDEYAVIFTGTGSTGAIDKLERIMGFSIPEYADKKWNLKERIPIAERPVIFISHFEHHSNELIWRESLAEVVVIKEDVNGQPDVSHLEKELVRYKNHQVPLIGSFSAGSNVTGIRSDTRAIARVLHKHGAYAFFDFAGVGAYVDIDMNGNGDNDYMDAIFLSPHKFIGGPGTSGILVARRKLFHGAFGVKRSAPSVPGGGTVSFVTQYHQTYVKDVESQEDAGTPGIPQCIKTGLVFMTKETVGSDVIKKLESRNTVRALESWREHPRIALMGSDRKAYLDPSVRVPIFSFNILSPVGLELSNKPTTPRQAVPLGCAKITPEQFKSINTKEPTLPLHHNFIIALLNDVYGIQARGGCSCAGPYGHLLFGIGGEEGAPVSQKIHDLAVSGYEAFKPGWARLNLNYFASDAEIGFMLEAVKQIATHGWKLLPLYTQELETGRYIHRSWLNKTKANLFSLSDISFSSSRNSSAHFNYSAPVCLEGERDQKDYQSVLATAMELYERAEHESIRFDECQDFTSSLPHFIEADDVWWLTAREAAEMLYETGENESQSIRFDECQDFTSRLPHCTQADDVQWLTARKAAKKLRRLRRTKSMRMGKKSHCRNQVRS